MQKRYPNFQDDDEFAFFKYHELSSIPKSQRYSLDDSMASQFSSHMLNNQNELLYRNNNKNIEKVKCLKDLTRQNQLYQISLKCKKILNEDFIQNQKLVIFKDKYDKECTCMIGNEVEYPKLKINEVYHLNGVKLSRIPFKNDTFQIIIEQGKITEILTDEQEHQPTQFYQEQQNNILKKISSTYIQPIHQIQNIQQPIQNSDLQTFYNILVIVVSQSETIQVWSSKCFKYFYQIKIDVMDVDEQLQTITLWKNFLEYKFTPYQIVFFQNLELKSFLKQKYLQTVDGISKIMIEDQYLQLLSNYDDIKLVAKKHEENEKSKKLITYREIMEQNPI